VRHLRVRALGREHHLEPQLRIRVAELRQPTGILHGGLSSILIDTAIAQGWGVFAVTGAPA
jgi:acyl-coenzyme A thioesterase PaaI-like protein